MDIGELSQNEIDLLKKRRQSGFDPVLEIQVLRDRVNFLESYLTEILKAQDCWSGNNPEIPEELSARLDIGLLTAKGIVSLFALSPLNEVSCTCGMGNATFPELHDANCVLRIKRGLTTA